jgi:hypothetical protein
MALMTNLTRLDVANNPFESPPDEVLARESQSERERASERERTSERAREGERERENERARERERENERAREREREQERESCAFGTAPDRQGLGSRYGVWGCW